MNCINNIYIGIYVIRMYKITLYSLPTPETEPHAKAGQLICRIIISWDDADRYVAECEPAGTSYDAGQRSLSSCFLLLLLRYCTNLLFFVAASPYTLPKCSIDNWSVTLFVLEM